MNRVVKFVLAANLIVLGVLAFVYPHLMVGPGKLIPGHSKLESNCFACHALFAGAASDRCAACHKPAEIGRLTTTGQPPAKPLTSVAFHQRLTSLDCVACHSDHAGVKRFRQQGRFSHALLQQATREQCQECHKPPGDSLHQQVAGKCGQCHGQEKWVPASFDHNKYFALDRDHNTRCVTCHVRNDYSRYTCYGCHEHSLSSIRREHVEEGIGNFDNCVECHRSATAREGKEGRGEERGKREGARGGREHDD